MNREEQIAEMKKMFGVYIQKASIMQSYFGLKKDERDTVAVELMKFLDNIEKTFLEQWNMVEDSITVIKYLEENIIKLGGDIETIRKGL